MLSCDGLFRSTITMEKAEKVVAATFVMIQKPRALRRVLHINSLAILSLLAHGVSTYFWKDPSEQQGLTPALGSRAK